MSPPLPRDVSAASHNARGLRITHGITHDVTGAGPAPAARGPGGGDQFAAAIPGMPT